MKERISMNTGRMIQTRENLSTGLKKTVPMCPCPLQNTRTLFQNSAQAFAEKEGRIIA
jgi:hypothetical protein